MSNPAIREAVLDSLPDGECVEAATIEELRYRCGLLRFTNKQVRRALESLRYGYHKVVLVRLNTGEGLARGWRVLKIAEN